MESPTKHLADTLAMASDMPMRDTARQDAMLKRIQTEAADQVGQFTNLEQRLAETALQRQLQEFLDEEAHMTKGLAAQSKKSLAREVLRLRALVKTVKLATEKVKIGGHHFGHAEAFALMTYREVGGTEVLTVWNSRDGVTPFIINIGEKKYEHVPKLMVGPFFDLPVFDLPDETAVTHKWVTRTDWQVMEAWQRTLERAVELGKMEPAKALAVRDSLEVAESWHYRIGLVNMSTGLFTDAEVLEASKAVITEEQIYNVLNKTGYLTYPQVVECTEAVHALIKGSA